MTEQQRRQYKATIAGKTYVISGEASLPHFKSTEELLNKQIKQIKVVAPKLSQLDQAILLTFNSISDQLYKQAEIDELREKIAEMQAEINLLQSQKERLKPKKSAVSSIIATAKQESRTRASNKIFKETDK
ncbi:MAG: cell division protein ZapA [Leuconostoc mesenteroides]|uniref:cell division protein ZapA n=1 Tax=Leuconostoc mesenteroides TaxID=1245 RepID=UPI0012392827|nr:cell division protein ZapA [Leuconostoc mesenteroides]KAA8364466.1 cell division protein ZapA [Leuconostoc mesenteroides]MBZ1512575.1 cell division protein ZapA [Leuconostoc mesenteroides]MBZ1530113.1 cell division protein ZapA [Leuconostoc mesenteroides]MBZ1531494.1 cell division protein ZapA [Leuconostoc mesenteroides]MCX2667003.1 cell division protein ZapA [Leuconostoc mesenteroides subsp. mesenteroides]